MKLGLTAKALALAVAVGVSSQVMANTTNGWWNINFENATTITALTNEASFASGKWTTSEDDESTIGTNKTVYLKLDTQGTDLTWEPNVASTTSVVLVNADIYLVGSDSEPTGFDTDENNPVQTAVYLKNYVNDDGETTNSVFCAYVADTESANKWIELTGVSMVDTNWYAIKIEVDYRPTIPVARFYVKTTQLVNGTDDYFQIANYSKFSTDELQKVNSVSFRGTGAVDNFVGEQIVPAAAVELQFAVTTFTDEVADGSPNIGGSSTGHTVNQGEEYFVIFEQFDGGSGLIPLSLVRVYTSGSAVTNDYPVSYEGGIFAYDLPLVQHALGIRLNIDTTGFTEGQTIEAYYGTIPSGGVEPADPIAPAIGGGDIGGAEPVGFWFDGETEYFTVTFAAPEGSVTYTLQTAATLGGTFTDAGGLYASETSTLAAEVITLKAPTGGATKMFFRVEASHPAAE